MTRVARKVSKELTTSEINFMNEEGAAPVWLTKEYMDKACDQKLHPPTVNIERAITNK